MSWSIVRSGDAHEVYLGAKEQKPPEDASAAERTAFVRGQRAVLHAMEHAAEGGSLAEFTAEVHVHGHGAEVHGFHVRLARKQ